MQRSTVSVREQVFQEQKETYALMQSKLMGKKSVSIEKPVRVAS